jgi:hypothetical protein
MSYIKTHSWPNISKSFTHFLCKEAELLSCSFSHLHAFKQQETHDPKIHLAIEKKIIKSLMFSSSSPSPSHGQIIIIIQASPIFPQSHMQGSILALIFQPLRESKFYHSVPSSISLGCNMLPLL